MKTLIVVSLTALIFSVGQVEAGPVVPDDQANDPEGKNRPNVYRFAQETCATKAAEQKLTGAEKDDFIAKCQAEVVKRCQVDPCPQPGEKPF